MKKVAMVVCVFGLMFFVSGILGKSFAEVKAVATPEAIVSRAEEAKARALQVLAARQWSISLTAKGAKKASESDVLTFSEGTVVSANLKSKGFDPSNVTLTLQENGTIGWETMQVSKDMEIIHMRGDLKGNVMTGVVSHKNKAGHKSVSYFTTL